MLFKCTIYPLYSWFLTPFFLFYINGMSLSSIMCFCTSTLWFYSPSHRIFHHFSAYLVPTMFSQLLNNPNKIFSSQRLTGKLPRAPPSGLHLNREQVILDSEIIWIQGPREHWVLRREIHSFTPRCNLSIKVSIYLLAWFIQVGGNANGHEEPRNST